MPGFRELLRHGAKASGNGLLTQAPPNTGAGWFTLATGAWPGVARLDQQHLPHQRPAVRQPHGGVRPGRAAGRDARPVRRARRQEGRADRVGRRPRRRDRRADARLPQLPLGPRRGDELHRRRPTRRRFTASFGLQFDHPAGFAGQRAVRAGAAPAAATGWTDVPRRSARRRRCACACSTAAPTSTASTPTSTTAATTAARATTASCFSPTKDGDDAVGDLREGEWADVKVTIQRRATLDGKTGGMLVKVERLARRPLAGPAVPHLGHARDRDLAELARRARLHRQLRGLRRRASSRPRRPATSPCSRPASSARRPTSSRALYWETAYHPLIKYVLDTLPAGPRAGRLPGHRRVPAPVPRPRDEAAAERRAATRPTTTSRSTARRTAASRSASASSATPTRARTRRCGSPRSACATAT